MDRVAERGVRGHEQAGHVVRADAAADHAHERAVRVRLDVRARLDEPQRDRGAERGQLDDQLAGPEIDAAVVGDRARQLGQHVDRRVERDAHARPVRADERAEARARARIEAVGLHVEHEQLGAARERGARRADGSMPSVEMVTSRLPSALSA